MDRRRLLKAGSTLGAMLAFGAYGRYRWLPPRPSRALGPVAELARRFCRSLDPATRERVCVEYDHPLRQYHNRGVGAGGLAIDAGRFTWEQRGMLTDLLHAGLSESGRERVPEEFFVQVGGVHWMKVLVCGDPDAPPYQLILSGPHLNLRLGGRSREGVAFGGPQVYGDQRGDGRAGLPGNLYRFQLEIGQRLYRSLDEEQRREAVLETAPIQTRIELRGRAGNFPGTPVVGLSSTSGWVVRDLVDGILSTYPVEDAAYAWECLEHNGGLDSLFLSYYADGELAGEGSSQIFRLEGPAAVLHFRGAPHVHAFVNIGKDGDAPLSVGETLGENPVALEGRAVKRLFERAMQDRTGADLAWYDLGAVVGGLRPGTIRTGDIYTLESWQDRVVVVEVRGSRLAQPLLQALDESGSRVDPRRRYAIATTAEVASESASDQLGAVESSRSDVLLRDATIAFLRKNGFGEPGTRPG